MEEKKWTVPAVDIFETDEKYVLILDMPGTKKENIAVEADGNSLKVSAPVNGVAEGWKTVSEEFRLADYRREFAIGTMVKRENIAANYENGLLRIELEKSDQVKPRKIEVKAA